MSDSPTPEKTEYERIAELAFQIYEQEGRPKGRSMDHWLRAERALRLLDQRHPRNEAP